MCCGSKRSAWRSASTSTPPPRAATMPASVAPEPGLMARAPTVVATSPAPPNRHAGARDAAVLASSGPLHGAQPRLDLTSARPSRRWGLTS
jgi:hypothetical protein